MNWQADSKLFFHYWKVIQFNNFILDLIFESKIDEFLVMSIHFNNFPITHWFFTNSTSKTIIYLRIYWSKLRIYQLKSRIFRFNSKLIDSMIDSMVTLLLNYLRAIIWVITNSFRCFQHKKLSTNFFTLWWHNKCSKHTDIIVSVREKV